MHNKVSQNWTKNLIDYWILHYFYQFFDTILK